MRCADVAISLALGRTLPSIALVRMTIGTSASGTSRPWSVVSFRGVAAVGRGSSVREGTQLLLSLAAYGHSGGLARAIRI